MDILEEGNGAPFSIICRTCLKAKQGMDSVYSSTIPDMLMYCVSLKVEHGDGLPNLICSQCIKQINQLFLFKRLCEKSESLLKHYLPLKIIPAQDLTTEDVTQNQILDTLEDPTLTSTSILSNDPLVEPLDEKDRLVETEDLISLSHYDGSSLFGPDVDLDTEQSLYPIQVNDFMNNFFDVTDNSLADSTPDISTTSFKDMDFAVEGSTSNVSCYHCPECKELLTCSEDLSIHMSIHVEGSLQCNVCKKTFYKKDSLKRHIKRHMKNKPMCCKICHKRFSDKCDLRRHLKRFNNEGTLFDHLIRTHNFIPHESENCQKELAQVSDLQQVQPGFPHSEQRFSCTLCSGHSYKRMSSLKDHICRVHPQTNGALEIQKFDESLVHKTQHKSLLFKCHVCNKTFPQKYRRKRHMLCHLRKGEIKEVNGNYIIFDLNNHDELSQQNQHVERVTKIVDVVDRTSLHSLECTKEPDADLIDRVIDHVAEDVQLTNIGSSFTNGFSNKDDNESNICKICKTKMMDTKDLKAHMSLHPINTSVWQCNVCQKCFSKKTFLSRHIKIHMTREMFPCEQCTKKFYEKSKLKKHIIKVHSRGNERSFKNIEGDYQSHTDKSATNSLSQSSLVSNSVSYSLDTTTDCLPFPSDPTKINSNHVVFPTSENCVQESKDLPQYFVEKYQDKENSYLKIGMECSSNIELSTNGALVNDISHSTIDSSYSLICSQNIHKLNSKMDSVQIDDSLKPESNYFCCEICGKQFEKAIKLSLHMRSHNQSQAPDANNTFQCAKNTYIVNSTHSIKTDEPETNFICQMSDEMFDTLNDLHLHSKVEHDVSEKAPPTCKICNISFTSIYKRRKHMQTHKILATNTDISV